MDITNRWNLDNITPFSKHLDTLEKKLHLTPNIFAGEIYFGKKLENKVVTVLDGIKDYSLILTVLKVVSLLYRIGNKFGGEKPLKKEEVNGNLFCLLKNAVLKWKNSIPQYIEKDIQPYEHERILELCRYSRFVTALLRSEKLLDEVFKLVIKDNFPVKMLVQYFMVCSVDLKNSLFANEVGYFNTYSQQKMLRIEKAVLPDGSKEKALQLYINKIFVNIEDNALIQMNDGKEYSWNDIKIMGERGKREPSEVAFFEQLGLVKFRPQGMGYPLNGVMVEVDSTRLKFWEDLPTFLTVSKEDLEKRLNITITKDKPCVATIESSCIDPFNTKDAHGATTIYLPSSDGLFYRAFPFGKYAEKFPQTDWENAKFIGDTVKPKLTYRDPGLLYSQRIHGTCPHLVTLEQAETLLTRIGNDIWNFQFSGNNCSADFQSFFEDMLGKVEDGGEAPNYFKHPLVESKFFFPADYVFDTIKGFHPLIASLLIHGVHVFCGSYRKYSITDENGIKKTACLYDYKDFSEDQLLIVPGMLVYRILNGEITDSKGEKKGVTWFGYH
jgi:hypothetical protein